MIQKDRLSYDCCANLEWTCNMEAIRDSYKRLSPIKMCGMDIRTIGQWKCVYLGSRNRRYD